ncbi:MAG: Oligopeptide transport ATP-binding protein OppF [Firmicutes bacterium]|nr:Oligopeptide transport ATP-binding protein OppF [Bacillota bacterium]MDI6707214.1 dipeptide ABC transporter ATP-binding protein [Bacillota bacterium]
MDSNILEIKNLKVYFPVKGGLLPKAVGFVKAVDGIDLTIKRGETLGLVGESGCGKSTTGRAILRLIEPNEGNVLFEGIDILKLNKIGLKPLRKKMQLIFQDPYASLNPRMTVGDALNEVLYVHKLGNQNERKKRTIELLEMVGLTKGYLSRYPHEFSGGQRQRVVIARALAVNPKLIICDEPVSALDVSIQAQIINLMEELQKDLKLTYLFIAHDLSVVKHISDRVAVMYLGRIVEAAGKEELFDNPRHPYTQALLSAIPVSNPDSKRQRIILEGDMPSPVNPPGGCRFHTRCHRAKDICSKSEPETKMLGGGHTVACHFA